MNETPADSLTGSASPVGRSPGITARIALILLLAILLESAGTLALQYWQDRQLVTPDQLQRTAQSLIDAARIGDAAPVENRAYLIRSLSDEELALNWLPQTVLTDQSDIRPQLSGTRRDLVSLAPDLAGREIRLNLLTSEKGDRRDLVGLLRLADGSFISFRVPDYLNAPVPMASALALHLLLLVAVFGMAFLMVRKIVRPLRELANAADATGRDRIVNVVPAGPDEVRRVAIAFTAMQQRLLRTMDDNIDALIAVSHDLRTPIQRLRLRLSSFDNPRQIADAEQDLLEMERFIDSALLFVRSGQDEAARLVDVTALIGTIVDDAVDVGMNVEFVGPDGFLLVTRPITLTRMLGNLIQNGARYGRNLRVSLAGTSGERAVIKLEDDGPGIPEDRRAEALRPFGRLENAQTSGGGAGLGLAMVERAARFQGGQLVLGQSAMGGLSAEITLPSAPEQRPGKLRPAHRSVRTIKKAARDAPPF